MNKYLIDETYKCSSISGIEVLSEGLKMLIQRYTGVPTYSVLVIEATMQLAELEECMKAIRQNHGDKAAGRF